MGDAGSVLMGKTEKEVFQVNFKYLKIINPSVTSCQIILKQCFNSEACAEELTCFSS